MKIEKGTREGHYMVKKCLVKFIIVFKQISLLFILRFAIIQLKKERLSVNWISRD